MKSKFQKEIENSARRLEEIYKKIIPLYEESVK